jgi:hypothetical protein
MIAFDRLAANSPPFLAGGGVAALYREWPINWHSRHKAPEFT